ncbi:MAG: PDZ domain-containing protein [Candidatus Nanopelagicales bacterium]
MTDDVVGPPDPDGPAPRPGRIKRLRTWWAGDAPTTPRERARSRAINRGVAAGMGLIFVGSLLRVPFLIMSPGPTYNTIGEVNGEPMIVVTGTTTYPTEGNLDMTTVGERGGSGGVTIGQALVGWVVPDRALVPRESVYGPETGEEVTERNDQLFALSKSDSIAAAMAELGIPTEESVVVTLVVGGSPADGILETGDVILTVDGKAVTEPADVGRLVRQHEVGETVRVEVLRTEPDGGEQERLQLDVVAGAGKPSAAAPDAPAQPYLGVGVSTVHEAPFDIEFTLENVGGPSAGLMFSLAIVDKLTKGFLNGGRHVAGTGTITPEGKVGPIGGIRQKLLGARAAGAELFLAPHGNCSEVVGHVPDGLTVVPVETLSDAREVVGKWVADPSSRFPTCQQVAESATG